MNNIELRKTIDNILSTLEGNFKYRYNKKLPYENVFELVNTLMELFSVYKDLNEEECCHLIIKKYIPILNLLITIDNNNIRIPKYYSLLKESYRISARRSFLHWLIYYEWDLHIKVFEPRVKILDGYIYYLNYMCWNKKDLTLIVNLPSGWAKCIDENSIINTPKGNILAKDLKIGDEVYSMNDRKVEIDKITNLTHTKKKPVKIKTRTGKEIKVSLDHRLYTQKGYLRVKDLKIGDYLYVLDTDIENDNKIDENELIFITCMLFEGHCGEKLLSYTGEDNEMTYKFLDSCKKLGFDFHKMKKYTKNKATSYRILGKEPRLLLDKYGIYKHLCYTKRLPQCFFTMPIEQRKKFIGMMVATDGYFEKTTGRFGISLANEKLIDDIQYLLQETNIISSKIFKKNNKAGTWCLNIPCCELLKLSDVYFYQKQQTYKEIITKDIKRYSLINTYPKELFENYRKDYLNDKHKKDRITCDVTCKYFNLLKEKHNELEKIEYKDFFFDKIVSIEIEENEIPMIDFTIEKNHNFLLNGIVSHNSYTYAQYCAFRIGIDQDGTFLSICSNDDLVKQMSRTIMNVIMSEQFGNVFPNLDYRKLGKSLFTKATDGEWKIKGNTKAASYIAKSRDSNVVGFRAYYSTFCDDMYKNPDESLDMNLNRRLFTDYQTVWTERTAKGYPKQFVLAGTIWSPFDLMTQVIELEKSKRKFKKHPKFDFTEISEDEKVVIIKVPALNEFESSNCPEIATTEELLEKRNNISTYLWECNFQQNPIPPEGLPFDYANLITYQETPLKREYAKAYIDANRKSGGDYFSMPILQFNGENWELIDSIFTREATTELYTDIVEKILEHHIITLVVESNVNDSLSNTIENLLKQNNITFCEIIEKWNTIPKDTRILMAEGTTKKRVIFPAKGLYGINTDLGAFMENFTTYTTQGKNRNDDACFDGDTLIATQFGYKKIKDIKIGDKVITPNGLKKVVACGVTGYKKTINKFGLNVTSNHKIYDKKNNEFISIDSVNSYQHCDKISLGGMIKWKKKLLYLMGKHTKEAKRADIILSTQLKMQKEEMQNNFMSQYGNFTMAKFRKDIIYTIKTLILIITTFLIWFVFRLTNIFHYIQNKFIKRLKYAKYVIKNFIQQEKIQKLVVKNVEKNTLEERKVYNMKVEDIGCYYANDILVSNCDSLAGFVLEIIEENSKPQKAQALDFVRKYM